MTINLYPPGWHEAFDQQITDLQTQFPEAHIYALIDGVQNESCYPFLKRHGGLSYFPLYKNTASRDDETLGLSPLLVAYDEFAPLIWRKLIEKTNGHASLSIIVTTESREQIAERLTPWCIVNADGEWMALSFSDTRILPELFKVLTQEQVGQLCGPALRWQYVTRHCTWQDLPMPTVPLTLADEVKLDEQQCARLIDASEADGVLYQLRRANAALVDCQSPARAHELTRHMLNCANHAQISSPPERVELCELIFLRPALANDMQLMQWLSSPSTPTSLDILKTRWIK